MLDPAVGGRRQRRRGRGGQPDRRVRRGVLQPADLAQRGARRDRGVVRGRGAGRPGGRGADRDDRAPGARLRRRRDVVRGRELPSLRASRAAARDGMGEPGRRGHPGRSAAGGSAGGRAAGAGADRAARLHVSRPEGLPVRRLAGAADVSRAVGGRAGAAGRPGLRPVGVAPRALRRAGAGGGPLRFLPPRDRRRAAGASEDPGRSLLVGPARDGAGAGRRRRARGGRGTRCWRARGSRSSGARIATPASSAARTAAATVTPTGCISRCTPTAGTGFPIRAPAPTSRAISSGTARPSPTTRRDSTASRSPRGTPSAAHSGKRATGPGPEAATTDFTRTLVAGPRYLLDILEFSAPEEHLVELPWHPHGDAQVVSPGRWEPEGGAGEFVTRSSASCPPGDGVVSCAPRAADGTSFSLHLDPGAGAAPRHGARPARLDRRCDVLPPARPRARACAWSA